MIVKITVNTVNEILANPYEGQRTQTDMFSESPNMSRRSKILGVWIFWILHIMQSNFIKIKNSIGVWCYFAWGGCCTGRRLCRITPLKR